MTSLGRPLLGRQRLRQWFALGGLVGPTAFVAAWTSGALVDDRQLSAVDDAISQLAHVESNTRLLMTAGLVGFAVGVALLAIGGRSVLGTATSLLLAATAASTLAVAALPLGESDTVDRLHDVAAGLGYVTLIGVPLFAHGPLSHLGAARVAGLGRVAAAVSAWSLATSLTVGPAGLFQRLGLAAVDAWIAVVAALIATGRLIARSTQTRATRSSASPIT